MLDTKLNPNPNPSLRSDLFPTSDYAIIYGQSNKFSSRHPQAHHSWFSTHAKPDRPSLSNAQYLPTTVQYSPRSLVPGLVDHTIEADTAAIADEIHSRVISRNVGVLVGQTFAANDISVHVVDEVEVGTDGSAFCFQWNHEDVEAEDECGVEEPGWSVEGISVRGAPVGH
jgi:hypothetical protein